MPKPQMKFVSLRRETQRMDDNRRWQQLDTPRTILAVATPTGSIREIELSTKDLATLLQQAAGMAALALNEKDGE
jgi:hypothetical protein